MIEPVDRVKSFLEAMAYAKQSASQPMAERGHAFVTISRQTGAGGHVLAKAILDKMAKEPGQVPFQSWYIFDAAMCKKVLEEARLRFFMEALVSEEFHSEVEDMAYQLLTDVTPQNAIYRKTFAAIRTL